MKIGLIGNMNNNSFALMRYLRDLGSDAHLLLFANDGAEDNNEYFRPDADTWEYQKWSKFVHQTKIPNAPIAAFNFPFSNVFELNAKLKGFYNIPKLDYQVRSVSKKIIRMSLESYDRLIGCGISPAVLHRAGKRLDYFFPYSTGVEFLGDNVFDLMGYNKFPKNIAQFFLKKKQALGLSEARFVTYSEEISKQTFLNHRIKSRAVTIPMVYNRENIPISAPSVVLSNLKRKIDKSSFNILHHARLWWKRRPGATSNGHWLGTKNSDWLIYSFAELLEKQGNLKANLILVEYGDDVGVTKNLISKLGIEQNVIWLPKMPRKHIMWLMQHVSIVAGEFTNPKNMIWGGTGWEALSSGTPLLQAFKYDFGYFEKHFGYPPPPMLGVRKQSDILKHLLFVVENPEKARSIGVAAKQWFDENNGISLAKKILELID